MKDIEFLINKRSENDALGQALASVVLMRTVFVFLQCKPVKLSVVVNRFDGFFNGRQSSDDNLS